MAINFFGNLKQAISNLNPQEIRDQAAQPVRIGLHAASELGYQQMENFFAPSQVSADRRVELRNVLQRAAAGQRYDIDIYSQEWPSPPGGFAFSVPNSERTVREILGRRPELALPLARNVYPFRQPVVSRIISKVAKENALFSLATAIPDIIPLISLPWAVGEFASDTVILTANQFRMAFFLAGASDRPIGYREQKPEIATICMGAFGWRAIARELVGKIPLGGGLLPKAAVAYAATRVVGMSIERYYRIGYGYTREERRVAYEGALERGKTIAGAMLSGLKHGQPSRL
jgi:hypothetical protein